jgi:polysaccharide pyruvyl transferase WcaK-like protein/glycosyltransferase involved in cell wall biosynthesis
MGIAQYGGPIVLAHLFGKPSMLYGVGVGPLATAEGRSLTRDLASLADSVTVRDDASRELLVELGCQASRITVTADPAFAAPALALPPVIEAQLAGLARPVLGVALRHWDIGIEPNAWEPAVARGLDGYLEKAGGSVLFVPFQTGTVELDDDRKVPVRVHDRMRHADRAEHLVPSAQPLERFHALERCDFVLGMRLHSIVAAAREGKPFVALAYDSKVAALAQALRAVSLPLPPNTDAAAERLAATLAGLVETHASPKATPPLMVNESIGRPDARLASDLIRDRSKRAGDTEAFRRIVAARLLEEVGASSEREEPLRSLARSPELHRRFERLQEQRDALLSDRIRVETDLEDLRGTLGVRLLGTYWDFLQRLIPAGSPPRALYARVSAGVRGLAPRFGLASDGHSARGFSGRVVRAFVGSGQSQPGPGRLAFAESRAELLRFSDQVALDGPKRIVTIISTTQLIQSEGQRATNLALECGRRGIPVVFAAWKWDTSPWIHQDRLPDRILQVPIDQLVKYPDDLLVSFPECERIVIFEFPHPEFASLMASANAQGWMTIYDVIDDWQGFQHMGQAPWYDEAVEMLVAGSADMVTCVNRNLSRKVTDFGRDDALVLPNGLVDGIDVVTEKRGLRRGKITLGYWGHLTSSWLDWELIRKTAQAEPDWVFYIAGYGDQFRPMRLPENVIFLGKVPQRGLSSIAENLDIGIVPFIPGKLSEGADVIKTYEYLAMGLPVVITGVEAPEGASRHVLRAGSREDFCLQVRKAAAMRGVGAEERKAYAQARTWGKRLDTLLEAIDRGEQRIGQKRWLFREDN